MPPNRERILQRLRGITHTPPLPVLTPVRDAALYANHPAQNDLIECFASKLVSLKGEFFRVSTVGEAAERIRELLAASARVANEVCLRHTHALLDEVVAHDPWLLTHTTPLTPGLPNAAFARFEAGLTGADFLIARTGSIVLNAFSAGGRRLSVLPPLHIVLATTAHMRNSLEEALVESNNFLKASYMTIITGPSRTSDIEKILVLGAHGPKRLAVIVMDKS